MPDKSVQIQDEIRKAYEDYERHLATNNFNAACILGIILMPAGYVLDRWVYPAHAAEFFRLRLLCSALIALFWTILRTPVGQRYYRVQGILLFMLPAGFIAWMIYATEGADSPYYAGLNLVLLVFTLGFAWPWVLVRSTRFAFTYLTVEGPLDLSGIVQEPQLATATGDALSSLLGADVDFA